MKKRIGDFSGPVMEGRKVTPSQAFKFYPDPFSMKKRKNGKGKRGC